MKKWIYVITTFLFFAICVVLSCCKNPASGNNEKLVKVTISRTGKGYVYPSDTTVRTSTFLTLTAIAESGYVFVGWYGDYKATTNPLKLKVTGEMHIHALFAAIPSGNMVFIESANKSFRRRKTCGSQTSDNIVLFTYNYFIDQYEMTVKEYNELLGTSVGCFCAQDSISDLLPVSNVRWYDAVLCCNAKSKKEGYDTVYSYTAICKATEECPYFLENLSIHYERFGYRLPTEAEWEYAYGAHIEENGFFWSNEPPEEYAWFFDNSLNKCHPVGTKKPNFFGLFDMAGNVAEWVNDWMAPYADTLQTNPVGPILMSYEESEKTFTRPIRGGAFSLAKNYMRACCREGPYPIAAKVAKPDVGFRMALGAFFAGTDNKGHTYNGDSGSIEVVAKKSDLINFLGTSEIKLVFVKNDNSRYKIGCIDFTAAGTFLYWLEDSLSVYSPTISGDGYRIAYSSKGEGFNSPSVMTVRLLDTSSTDILRTPASQRTYLPRWWNDSTTDTFLIYTDGASINRLPEWKLEKTFRRKIKGLTFIGPPEVICDTGSFHGGLSYDGRFLATGYSYAYVMDRKFGNIIQYFVPPFNGRSDTVQVCNVSVTPSFDTPDQIMLLDFGSPTVNSIVGRPYDFHSIIFICNSASRHVNHVVNWIDKPLNFQSWDDVEWTNHPGFAVGLARKSTDEALGALFLIDCTNGRCLELVRGNNIRYPFVWINPKILGQRVDLYRNFAKYDIPMVGLGQPVLAKKMKLFWKIRDKVEAIFFGSSLTHWGVDPSAISSLYSLNMGTCGIEILFGIVLTQNYALNHASKLKLVGLELMPSFLDLDNNPEDPSLAGVYDSKGFEFDKANNFWRDSIPRQIIDKIAQFDSSTWSGIDSLGFSFERFSNSWGEPIIEKGDYSFDTIYVQQNLGMIKTLADTLANRGIHLLVINFPQNPLYKQTPMIGRHGPSKETYAKIVAWLKNLESTNHFFHFYDANLNGEHDYTDQEAMDTNHLGYLGARKLASRIDSIIKVIIP